MAISQLDQYITGVHATSGGVEEFYCPVCGEEQYLVMFYDMGAWCFASCEEEWTYCSMCLVPMAFQDTGMILED